MCNRRERAVQGTQGSEPVRKRLLRLPRSRGRQWWPQPLCTNDTVCVCVVGQKGVSPQTFRQDVEREGVAQVADHIHRELTQRTLARVSVQYCVHHCAVKRLVRALQGSQIARHLHDANKP